MSDTSQGDGWWQATDGKWYPPAGRGTGAKAPSGLEPAPEIASYGDVPWYRRTWLVLLSLLLLTPVAIVLALTGDLYQKANRRTKAHSDAEVWRYTDRGRWTIVIAAVVFMLFTWVNLAVVG